MEVNSNKAGGLAIVGRSDFLFMAGAIAVVVGLLFPLSAHILDVLLIFSVSLTAAVLIITFSAREALQVQGFPLLTVLATALRMALSVACAKLILLQGNAGTIINLLGTVFVRNNCVLAILIFGTLTIVIFGAICKAVKSISLASTEFTSDIVPIRQTSINSDLNAGIIDKSQALNLRERITREVRFFVAMAGAARFILCAAAIELAIVIVNITASIAMGVAASTSGGISVKTYAILAVGAGMITQITALLVAVASVYLVRKSSVSAADSESTEEAIKTIKVSSSEVASSRITESQYSSTVTPIQAEMIAKDVEWLDESRCIGSGNEDDNSGLWVCREIADSDCYEPVVELIESKSREQVKTILMAAESAKELPVTVPVNIAIRLAQKGHKCLLIDLDLERSAISKVFDADSGNLGDNVQGKTIAKETPTCISNLWVWPAGNFGKADGNCDTINIKEVIVGLESRYDHLIVYAPNINLSADWGRIVGCIQAAMLFGPDRQTQKFESSSLDDFRELLISLGCAVLEPAEVFAMAV